MPVRPDFLLPGVLTPKYAAVSASTSGNNTLVSAVASKKILVLGIVMIADGDVNATLEDGAGGTALSGALPLTSNSGFSAAFSEVGWCKTSTNTLLNLALDGAVQVSGFLTYTEIP